MSFPPAESSAPQLSLFGGEPPRATDRLFFAVLPDPASAEAIALQARELARRLGLRGRPRPTAHFHVTLHHLGDYAGLPADVLEQARKAGEALRMAPFDASFDSASSFQGSRSNRPFVLRGDAGVRELGLLQQQLGQCMATSGLGRRVERNFVPHVTLLYDDRQVPPQPLLPLSWRVERVVLMHSLLGRTEHHRLAEWPLRGADAS